MSAEHCWVQFNIFQADPIISICLTDLTQVQIILCVQTVDSTSSKVRFLSD